eukprot:223698-Lingulodinium_polyedra.AAC.1
MASRPRRIFAVFLRCHGAPRQHALSFPALRSASPRAALKPRACRFAAVPSNARAIAPFTCTQIHGRNDLRA